MEISMLREPESKKYSLKNETLLREVKAGLDDNIQIEIGDSKQPDFKPQFKISRWDNEVNFSIRAEEKLGARVETEGEVIKYITPEYEVHQYEKPDAGEDGGFEFEWILNNKPSSNVLNATIQTKELDFFYQPELTPQEIADGSSRADNVVGSYAVYHKTQKNNKVGGKAYKTGKAFHIYRPKAIDAKGKETWCDLNIDIVSDTLSVTIPPKFLNTAHYPIIVDPTFGYTSAGASSQGTGTDIIRSSEFTLSTAGHVSKITLYWNNSFYSGGVVTGIYEANTNPKDLFGQTERVSGLPNGDWQDFNFGSPVSLTAADYGLTYWGEDTSIRYDDGVGAGYSAVLEYDGVTNLPDPWDEDTTHTRKVSIYATYTTTINYTLTASRGIFSATGMNANLVPSGGSPLIDAVSGTNAGFANQATPADTDPFNQGEQICYTVQPADELTPGTTYYWRVRVKDPSGSDVWSDWTATRSFITSTAYNITASVGGFSLNGVDSVINLGKKLVATVGSFILSGIDVVLNLGRTMTASVGSFILSGIDVSLLYGKLLTASVGNFTLTGIDVVFGNSLTMISNAGSFVLTGFAASLRRGIGILAEKATFILTGVDAALRAGVALTAAVGSFTLTGIVATLNKGKTIVADVGSFVLSGIDSVLNIGRKIAANVGSFTLSGIDVILGYGRSMAVSAGSFTLTGIAATFNIGINLVAATGQFILTGIVIRVPEWFNKIKNSSVWSNSSKNSSSFTNQSKSSSTWTNQSKS